MDSRKLENEKNSITESRNFNKFKYTLLAPGVHIYDNVWDQGMDFMKQLEDKGSFVREDYIVDSEGNKIPKEVGKRGVSTWVKRHQDPQGAALIANAFEEVIDSYLWHYDLDPKSREEWRISKYTDGDYFGMHPDDSYGTPRTISMVYYPNDDYEGGELEFIHFGVKVKPKANQLIIFPSSYIYEHRITDIGAGNPRYTIVSFLSNITQKERNERLKDLPNPYKTDLKYISEIK
jgi:hypothetical protein